MESVEQRRANPRSRTLLEGYIIYNNRLSRMECSVRDLSDTGARVVFAQPVKVPAQFELQIPKRKLVRQAQVMWYDGQNHGVMFLDDEAGQPIRKAAGIKSQGKVLEIKKEPASVPDIIEDARHNIARLLGVSVDVIQLKLEIDR
jgi:hypothetical protein